MRTIFKRVSDEWAELTISTRSHILTSLILFGIPLALVLMILFPILIPFVIVLPAVIFAYRKIYKSFMEVLEW